MLGVGIRPRPVRVACTFCCGSCFQHQRPDSPGIWRPYQELNAIAVRQCPHCLGTGVEPEIA